MKTRMVIIALAVAALGCNKSGTGPEAGVSHSCTVNLSGAASGTYDCRPAVTTWSSLDNTGAFTFAVPASGTVPAISVPIVWDSEPTTRTYTNTDPLAEADIRVTNSSGQVWRTTVGNGLPATGTYSLTFTSVVYNLPEQGGKGYTADGTLTATLPAVTATGATAVVILTATF